jgi:ankyrin repeat protein
MKIRNIMAWKVAGIVILLTVLVCCGSPDNQLRVYETIQEAAEKGDFKDVKRHLKRGADVNAKNKDGWAPLHMAASGGHKDVAELLIAKGADVNAKNKWGETPLDLAVKKGHISMVVLLKKHGAR